MQHPCFEGRLFRFGADPYCRMPVFLSGNSRRCVLFVGGQTDGLFSLNFMPPLLDALVADGWCVAQVMLSSSFGGCETRNLWTDVEDIGDLIQILVKEHNVKEIAICGYSTGVQIVHALLLKNRHLDVITRVVLHGVAAETDEPFTEEATKHRVEIASQLVSEGRGADFFAMSQLYDLPTSAARVACGGFLSLQEMIVRPAHLGDRLQLRQNLMCIPVPLLVMIARNVIQHDDGILVDAVTTNVRQCAPIQDVSVAFFDEVCDEKRRMLNTAQGKHTEAFIGFLREEDRKRNEREEQRRQQVVEDVRKQRSVLAKSELRVAPQRIAM